MGTFGGHGNHRGFYHIANVSPAQQAGGAVGDVVSFDISRHRDRIHGQRLFEQVGDVEVRQAAGPVGVNFELQVARVPIMTTII